MRVPSAASSNGEIARRWMEMVLGEKFQSEFTVVLRTGTALCDLVNKVFKALGMKDQVRVLPSQQSASGLLMVASNSLMMNTDPRYASSRPPRGALQNIQAYLSACDLLGVDVDDMFEPDDLLLYKNIDRVYRNILALQAVAVSLSTRRSIDERSSLGTKPTFSPISDQGIAFLHDDGFESPPLIDLVTHMSWPQLLSEYEQQLAQRERDLARVTDPSASTSDGLGELAHDIWGTEERIRALLVHDDRAIALVPDELHGQLWLLASGAAVEMRRHAGQYAQLAAMDEESTEATQQIDVDLFRTVSSADKATWSDVKTAELRRVLVAYSHYNPTLGYCQGLNYIAARMLQFVDEEEAFYLLIKLIRLVPEDYYTSMLGLAVDQHVFADLVRLQMPDITEHLAALNGTGVELSLACTEWFLTLFASPCDKDVTVRIWDAIFLLGDELLFRVALALMQLEKSSLLACEHYGDLLKHLNEIGRGKTDAFDLMTLAREQDSVYRARIEDFRAHHRLQLASGIVASTVESEDVVVTSSAGRPSAETKPESKPKRIGKPKKHGIFRHLDRNAGRMSRTIERYITEDYAAALQKDHPNAAWYYDGAPPMVFDRYWGSKESYNQWGTRHVRLLTGPEDSPELDRRRLQSDGLMTSFSNSSRRMGTSSVSELSTGAMAMPERSLARERRSKSTAFIPSKKHSGGGLGGSSSITQQLSQSSIGPSSSSSGTAGTGPTGGGGGSSSEHDPSQYGRSPRTWIQKIEDWHRELKLQKEKKKAEKRRSKLDSRGDSTTSASRSSHMDRGSSAVRRTRKSLSSSPPPRSGSMMSHAQQQHRSSSGRSPVARKTVSGDGRGSSSRGSGGARGASSETSTMSELPLSRSFSDPFHSPSGVLGRSPWQHAAKHELADDIDAQILIRSQDPHSQSFHERIADHASHTRQSRRDYHQQPSSGGGGAAALQRAASFQQPRQPFSAARERRSFTHLAARPATIASEGRQQQPRGSDGAVLRYSLPSADMRRPPPPPHPKAASSSSSSSNPYDSELSLSPLFSQLRSSELLDEDYDEVRRPAAQPLFWRTLSTPVGDSTSTSYAPLPPPPPPLQPKWMARTVGGKRPPTAESARVIRDRAHVVSYLQRKLSDASSLAGSISRSPRGEHQHQRGDTQRLSGDSVTSSRLSDPGGAVTSSSRSAASSVLALPYRKGSFSFFDKLSSDLEHRLDDLNASYPTSEVDFGAADRRVALAVDDFDDDDDIGSVTLPLPAKSRVSVLDEWRRRSSFTSFQHQ